MGNAPVKLSVQDVCKTFRLRGEGKDSFLRVLQNVNFEVRQGEIVSLIGESGCGKTTLLRIIQGLSSSIPASIRSMAVPSPGRAATAASCSSRPACCPGARRARMSSSAWKCRASPRRAPRPARHGACWIWSAWARPPINIRISCPAACSSASAWRGRWRSIPAILLMDEPFSALDAQTREVLQARVAADSCRNRQDHFVRDPRSGRGDLLSNRVVVLVAKPGRVKKIIDVPFAYPRPELPELRGDPRVPGNPQRDVVADPQHRRETVRPAMISGVPHVRDPGDCPRRT